MIYLDNAATSFPKPESVPRAMEELARDGAGNPGRGGHAFVRRSEECIARARRAVAALLGVSSAERVVFALNATDALNMAIKGVLRQGDHAVTTDLEHNSVSRPLEGLRARGTIELTRVESGPQGRVDPGDIERAITNRTRIVAIIHASNVLGVVQDAAAIAAIAHRAGALVVLDAAQSAGVIPIETDAWGIDLCAFTGHKGLLGPMGTGGLIVGKGLESEVAVWREGGTGGDSSLPTQPPELPHRLEAGTPNAVGLAGMVAGLAYLAERGIASVAAHERALACRLQAGLARIDGVEVDAGPGEEHRTDRSGGRTLARGDLGLVSFRVRGFDPAEVGAILDESFGIAVRAGLHCAPYVHRRRGWFPEGSVRASFGPFSTEADADALVAAAAEIAAG